MPAITSFLRQAVAILQTHNADPNHEHRRSAAYLPLSKLLGEALNNHMRDANELDHDYEYVGNAFAGDDHINEHVVPMNCIIQRLFVLAEQWESGEADVARLRTFLRRHIVMARIPKGLNALLPPQNMPREDWWQPVGENFTERQKQQAIWSRYLTERVRPPLLIPFEGDTTDFCRRR